FVNDLVKDKYCATFGRPAWAPETIARICILQMLYDLSDEAIIDEICVNRAAEYFCGLSPVDKRPHPTTLCKFRQLRLDDNIMDK
ncbi:MAG: transposase, partial [Synergistes sp.]|nr:transposase [Synergistes sp.]